MKVTFLVTDVPGLSEPVALNQSTGLLDHCLAHFNCFRQRGLALGWPTDCIAAVSSNPALSTSPCLSRFDRGDAGGFAQAETRKGSIKDFL